MTDTENLPALPANWCWTKITEFSEVILGQSPPSSTYNENGVGLPFYQRKAEFGELYLTTKKWCTSPKKVAERRRADLCKSACWTYKYLSRKILHRERISSCKRIR